MGFIDDIAAAATSPTFDSLSAAQGRFPDLTLTEYACARVIASEHFSGKPAELCCIADADLNKAMAEGRNLVDHITGGTGQFGSQGSAAAGKRQPPVSSARPPTARPTVPALAVTRRR